MGLNEEVTMKKWKVAIVGAGYMAQEHAKAFASLPEVEIAGVCSRTRARAETLAATYGTAVYDSVEAMYQATNADAVVVAVNELSMKDVCNACFQHPWLCFLEKPVGINLEQAESILASQREHDVRAYVALNRRSYASTRAALRELEGDHGPRLISVLDQQDLKSVKDSGQPDEVVRNYMYANSIHLIDYFHIFGRGEVVAVEPFSAWDPARPGIVVASIRFDSGDIGVYQAMWDGPGPWAVSVTDHATRAELRPLERLSLQRRGERALTHVPADTIDQDFKPGLRHQAEQVVKALAGQSVMLATLEEAAASMTLCSAIYGLD